MAAISFGYTSGGSGSLSLSDTNNRAYVFPYVNDTGVDVYVDTIRVKGISTSSGSIQWTIAVYSGDEIGPQRLLYNSAIQTGMVPGDIDVVLPDILPVAAGELVWFGMNASSSFSFSYGGSSSKLIFGVRLMGSSVLMPSDFMTEFVVAGIMPAEFRGDTVGPGDPTNIRAPYAFAEDLTDGYSDVRVPYGFSQPLTEGYSNIRASYGFSQPLTEGYSNVRVCYAFCQALFPVGPEEYMSEIPFPGFGNSVANPAIPAAKDPFNSKLPGLAFSVHKKPSFRTRISSAASGNEVRNTLMQYPIWDFELTYEFLEDSSGADSSLKTILGFFLSRQGSFDSWLFKDPDDYLCDNHYCGDSDGVNLEFPFSRVMGGFRERVGQVDTSNTVTVFLTIDENGTIPASPGPYTITVANSTDFVEDLGVTKGGTPMTRVTSAPAAGQYSVAAGVYTFNATDENDAVVIRYRYTVDPADYTVTMPNRLIFDSAPPTGEVSWSGQFFFVCRFAEDQQDYEKFYDKLWNLQECNFRSIIA